ncbi:ABC transporter permease [Roseateles oligotrophus]|uniref:FtsX-like permease family protein n=1 Tax=Roseateles oligotrophus TaxID=1769250 RepID=A0ABT2YB98_9BURK|nr:FtsX-like permease family protein [Roseateles oligotrophus]MCV2367563.1 FtsX-like permease family protein [Roseateles oligotrophus]
MNTPKFSLSMTLRDWRAGELQFLLIALTLSVAAIASVSFFVDRIRAGMNRDAGQMLAADLRVASDTPLGQDWQAAALQRGLQTAETIETLSVAMAGQGIDTRSHLVGVKAVSAGYPLRGELRLKLGEFAVAAQGTPSTPPPGSAWVDELVLSELKLKLGEPLQLGDKTFRVTHIISSEPDSSGAMRRFAPRVMIAQADLAATQLIGPASLAIYRLLLAGAPASVEAFKTELQAKAEARKLKNLQVDSLASSRAQLGAVLQRGEQFLALVSLLSALLAAVAVAMAARRFMLRHLNASAMLRVLGLTQNQLGAVFFIEFLLVCLLGSAAGVAIGYAGHFVLLEWLGNLLGKELPAASWLPALQCLASGLVLLLGFALPPLLQLRHVPLVSVMRQEPLPMKGLTLASYGLGLLAFVGLLLWQTGDVRLAGLSVVGFLLGFALFAAAAVVSLRALKLTAGAFPTLPTWRFAVTALQRRPAATVTQIVALSIGLMALLLLTLVRNDLMKSWQDSAPADAPNHVIFNIMPQQAAVIGARLAKFGAPEMQSQMRGHLAQINGKNVADIKFSDAKAQALAEREFELSDTDRLPPKSKITAGRWHKQQQHQQQRGPNESSKAEVSVDAQVAKRLGLKLGDRLSFALAGQTYSASITSLRSDEVQLQRLSFSFLLKPDSSVDLPRTYLTNFFLPAGEQRLITELLHDFPNLSVLDFGTLLQQAREMLDQVAMAVEFLFAFTLAAGVAVLYAALAGSQDLRMQEAALLRTLGATRQQLRSAQWLEYLLMGGLAGLLAASGAAAISWALAKFVFHLAWSLSPQLWLAGLALGAVCAVLGGWLGLRKILTQAPLLSLRGV